jgi:hypothetical protein
MGPEQDNDLSEAQIAVHWNDPLGLPLRCTARSPALGRSDSVGHHPWR